MSDWQKASADGVEPEMSKDLGDRVSAVIAAAESAAQAVRDGAEEDARARQREAEDEAARCLDEARRDAEALSRRLRESSQELLESARAVVETVGSSHRQLEGLVEDLSARFAGLYVEAGQTSARSAQDPGTGADPPTGVHDELARPVTTARMPPRDAVPVEVENERAGSATFDGDRFGSAPPPSATPEEERARRAALQMAAAGRTRGEVAHHLHEVFDLDRVEPVLAHIFGPEDERG